MNSYIKKAVVSNTRTLFSKQTAKCIAINLDDFDKRDLEVLCHSLEIFFQFTCAINDVNMRIPYLSIAILSASKLISYTAFDTLHSQTHSICTTIKQIKTTSLKAPAKTSDVKKAYFLEEILSRFLASRQQEKNLRLEVVLFSFSDGFGIELGLLESGIYARLKKVHLINLYGQSKLSRKQMNNLEECDLSNVLQVMDMKLDSLTIVEFMKQWLNDSSKECEHLHIVFHQTAINRLLIKCDIFERILNPKEDFKQGEYVYLDTKTDKSLSTPKKASFSVQQTDKLTTKHIFILKVIKFIRIEGVCESLLYGDPIILKASSSFILKYEEFEENAMNFQCLSLHMQKNNLALLCCIDQTEQQQQQWKSHYVIMPKTSSDDNNNSSQCLLMKAIATRNILLNDHLFDSKSCEDVAFFLGQDQHKYEQSYFYQSFLNKIEIDDAYNPFTIQDDL